MDGKIIAFLFAIIGLCLFMAYFMYTTQKQLNFMSNQIKVMDEHWEQSNEAVNSALTNQLKTTKYYSAKREAANDFFAKNPNENHKLSPKLTAILAKPAKEFKDAA